jgi:pimeloyl-ACP methyl ester carboxylesterase
VNPWSLMGSGMAAFLSNPLVAPIFLTVAPFLKFAHGYMLRRIYGDVKRIRPGTLEGYSAPFRMPGAFRYGLSVLRTWPQDLRELESVLPRITHIPTLIMWGGLDNAVDPSSAEKLRQQFQNSRLVMLEGVGHLPYEEVPDEFNRTVKKFLSEVQPAF